MSVVLVCSGCASDVRRTAQEDRLIHPHIEGVTYASSNAAAPDAVVVSYVAMRQFNHLNRTFYLRVPLDERGVPVPPFAMEAVPQLTPRLAERVAPEQRGAVNSTVSPEWSRDGLAARRSRRYAALPTTGPSARHHVRTSWPSRGEDSVAVLALLPGPDVRPRYRAGGRAISMGEMSTPTDTLLLVVPAVLREPAEMRKAKQRAAVAAMPGAVAHDVISGLIHPIWAARVIGAYAIEGEPD